MRQRLNTLFIVLWVTLWLAFVFPALAQDATPEATAEATAQPEVIVAPVPQTQVDGNFDRLLDFLADNQVLWMLLFTLALLIAGRSVPPEAIAKLRQDAEKTETPIDDIVARILEAINQSRAGTTVNVFDDIADKNTNNPPVTFPSPPRILEGPAQPPVPRIGVLNRNPDLSAGSEVRVRGDNRQFEVPDGWGAVDEPGLVLDVTAGKAYQTHANVRCKAEYGLRFELANVQGAWGIRQEVELGPNPAELRIEYEGANLSIPPKPDGTQATMSETANLCVFVDGKMVRQEPLEDGLVIGNIPLQLPGKHIIQVVVRVNWAVFGDMARLDLHSVRVMGLEV